MRGLANRLTRNSIKISWHPVLMSFTTNTPSFEFDISPITQMLFPYIQGLANINTILQNI